MSARVAFSYLSFALLPASVLFPASPSPVLAQQPGDAVVVTENADMKIGRETVEEVSRAMVLRVKQVQGDWLWVTRHATGWIHRRHVATLPEALEYLEQQIQLNPREIANYNDRATMWFELGNYDSAIADYTRALRLNPNLASVYNSRGIAYFRKGDFEQAVEDLNRVVQLRPDDPRGYDDRGWVLHNWGKYDQAADDYQRAFELDGDNPVTLANRAWLWSACPDASLRDGERALEAARKACELTGYNDGFAVGALAAAHAETGDFEQAVRWQKKALELAPLPVKPAYRERLEALESGKPVRARGKTNAVVVAAPPEKSKGPPSTAPAERDDAAEKVPTVKVEVQPENP